MLKFLEGVVMPAFVFVNKRGKKRKIWKNWYVVLGTKRGYAKKVVTYGSINL